MLKLRLGASTCGHVGITKNMFEGYKAAGITAMEVSPKYHAWGFDRAKDVFKSIDFKLLQKYSEETGVELWSLHLPFGMYRYDPAAFDKSMRIETIETDCEMIRVIGDSGIKTAVIHPSTEPIEDSDRKESMKYSIESLLKINETAKECGVTLAIENLPRTCLCNTTEELLEILRADDNFRVCFDVNHLLIQSHKDFVEAVGSKIITLHISDYDFIDERHWIPGKGKINWQELVELLMGVGYSGPFMNEVEAHPDGEAPEGKTTYSTLSLANKKILDV